MRLKINAVENNAPEVLLYDVIGGMDFNTGEVLTAKSFIEQMRQFANSSLINIRINSAGGSVFDAIAIYNYLLDMSCEIHVYIDGLAASAASLIVMAGDKVFMPKNALIMIHNPSSFIDGNSEDLKNAAETLDKVRNGMLEIYMAKTGMERGELIKMLDAETWLDADEALKLGFCDEIINAVEVQACAFDSGKFGIRCGEGASEISPELAVKFSNRELFGLKINNNFKLSSECESHIEVQGVKRVSAVDALEEIEDEELDIRPVNHFDRGAKQFNLGVEAERNRLKELDDLLKLVPECAAIINQAKYESFKHAGDIALEVLRNSKALKALSQDAQAIDAAVKPEIKEPDSKLEDLLIKNLNNLRGV